ncbi:ribonuclease H-like protein [Trametes coccinea BRFM310]|uniref:3'-5' exonuclease n=1 Tax=Trametes coccinea (strain BRFM310) TaxID=1353009 RepID=A0A1Y2IHJ3_TRAC3|nr:ribonuclease H-like protein [Trametes coccinea BRFM310]
MAVNAFKETKLSANLCHRMSPPSSPSRRVRARSASHAATAATSRHAPTHMKSRLLATLDAEIPQWLSGPSASLSESANTLVGKTIPPLVDPKPIHPFFSSSQSTTKPTMPAQRTRAKTAPVSTSSKARSRSKTIPTVLESDVENHPEEALDVVDVAEEMVEPAISLPTYSYEDYVPSPGVVYTHDEGEANDLVQCLKGSVLGFDLEWVVTFRKGYPMRSHRTALVQLCDARMIVLIQVSAMKKFPEKVKAIIENKDVFKLGANIKNDGQKLFRDYGILARGLVELGAVARRADPAFSQTYKRSIVSLARVVEMYTQKTLPKGKVRTSNWEAVPLTEEQKFYAANDAHCALMVYNRLKAIAAENGLTMTPDTYAADLALEYQAKTVSGQVTTLAPRSTSGSSSSKTSSAPSLSTNARPSSSAGPSAARAKSPYARPLAIAGEYDGRVAASGTSARAIGSSTAQHEPPRPQHLRAYNLWHHRSMSLPDICAALRTKDNPLAASTVISYVVRALQADPTLPFSMARLKEFVQLEAGSWARHREWILQKDGYMG